jgi:peroxiredoxin
MNELEQRFSQLEGQIQDSPNKEALSILHAMIQEGRRELLTLSADKPQEDARSFEHIANLYKTAPGMDGEAENEGLPDQISLSDFRGKNVLLVFYPLDWSPACSDQLSLYQSELEEFEKQDTQVIAVSVDSLYSHGAWAAVRGITFPLLADFQPKGDVSRLYNVMRSEEGFSERALYIVDREGVIYYNNISPRLPHIPDIYELFEKLEALNAAP